jgi:hypothetical protein
MPNGVIGVKDGKVRTHAYALPKDAHFYWTILEYQRELFMNI